MLPELPSRNKCFWFFSIILTLSTAIFCYSFMTSAGNSTSLKHRFVSNSRLHDPAFFASELLTLPFSASLTSFANGDSVEIRNSTIPQIRRSGRLPVVFSKSDEVFLQKTGDRAEALQRSQEYCNVLKHSKYDDEKDIPPTYNLISVVIVVRHGDRSPIYTLPNHRLFETLSCKLADDRSTQSQTFLKFISLVESRQSKQIHQDIRWQNSYPKSAKCAAGQLTSRGFQQMINLGKTLRRIYADSKHFLRGSSNLSSEVYVRATEYTRAFQSAVGFLYGFLSSSDFKRVKIDFDRDIYFCSQSVGNFSCNCPAATKLEKMSDQDYQHTDDKTRTMGRQLKEKLATVFGTSTSQIPWLGAVLEVAMTHVCHGLSPPCRQNSQKRSDCMPWSVVSKLWNYLDSSGQRRQNSTASEKYARLVSYPLLHEIVQRLLTAARDNTHQKSRIHLFSGHDKTIAALLKSLKIYDGHWPPYASNLVFELYERKKQFYVRFRYNGKDVTKQVRFCRNIGNVTSGLCPFDNFTYFIFYETFRYFGTSNYEDMCRL